MNGIKKFGGKVACDAGETGTAAGLGEREALTQIFMAWEGERKEEKSRRDGGAAPGASRGVSGTKPRGLSAWDITEITHGRGASCQAPADRALREMKGNK